MAQLLRAFGLVMLGLSALFQGHAQAQATQPETISSLRWSARIILVWPDEDASFTLSQLRQDKVYLDERHVIWFVVDKAGLVTNYEGQISADFVTYLSERYPKQQSKVWLIGKDGGIKQTAEVLNLDAIYDQIDAMPMRQREMQR